MSRSGNSLGTAGDEPIRTATVFIASRTEAMSWPATGRVRHFQVCEPAKRAGSVCAAAGAAQRSLGETARAAQRRHPLERRLGPVARHLTDPAPGPLASLFAQAQTLATIKTIKGSACPPNMASVKIIQAQRQTRLILQCLPTSFSLSRPPSPTRTHVRRSVGLPKPHLPPLRQSPPPPPPPNLPRRPVVARLAPAAPAPRSSSWGPCTGARTPMSTRRLCKGHDDELD